MLQALRAHGCRQTFGNRAARRLHATRRPARRAHVARAQAPPSGGAAGAFPSGSDSEFDPPPSQPVDLPGSSSSSSSSSSGGSAAGKGAGALEAIRAVCLAYDRAAKTRPVLTKALTSFVGFALGDRIAQSVVAGPYDPFRCVRLSLYGLLIDGPVGHKWYEFLDKHVCPDAPTSNKAVLIKTALDQLVWGPVMTLVFFAFLKTLEGRPDLILHTIETKFWPTMAANYVLWPLAHLINFRYVPSDWRILFNNVVAIGWTTYLSFTCGPASGGAAGSADGAAAAAAASALLSAIPCSKVPGALHNPGLAEAAQQVAAFQQILACWGTKSLPADALVEWVRLKAEVMQAVCQQPVRLPPP